MSTRCSATARGHRIDARKHQTKLNQTNITNARPLLPTPLLVSNAHASHHRKVVLQPLMHGALERYVCAAKHERKKQPDENQEEGNAAKPVRIGVQGPYSPLRLSCGQPAKAVSEPITSKCSL